jgi:hypothetical protein
MGNVITLILDLRPMLRYKGGGSGPRKCNGIQTHPHKCEKVSPKRLSHFDNWNPIIFGIFGTKV